MSKQRECKDVDCEGVSVEGSPYCEVHVGAKRRCKATRVVEGVERQCKRTAMLGLDVCQSHGGRFPQSRKQHDRAVALTAMQRFVKPYEGDMTLISSFEMEYRRCLGRIAWYDEQLALLSDEKDLIWGLTKREEIGASEFAGKNKTYEAKANILVEMQWKERVHLLNMQKVWIGAGLEQQRLDQIKAFSHDIERVLTRAFDILGLDLRNPDVVKALQVAYGEQSDIIDVSAIEA